MSERPKTAEQVWEDAEAPLSPALEAQIEKVAAEIAEEVDGR